MLLDVTETHVLQGRVSVSGGVVRPPGAGQVLEQRQPPAPLAVWRISLLLRTQAAEQLCLLSNCMEKLRGSKVCRFQSSIGRCDVLQHMFCRHSCNTANFFKQIEIGGRLLGQFSDLNDLLTLGLVCHREY